MLQNCTFDFRVNHAQWQWFKTKLYITNNTEHFIVFKRPNITVQSPRSARVKTRRKRDIIVGPKQELRYALRFDGLHLHRDSIVFRAQRMAITGQALSNFEAFRMQIVPKNHIRVGPVQIEILKISKSNQYYKVRVRMMYDSDQNFLGCDFSNILIRTVKGETIKNQVKRNFRTWLTKQKNWELTTLRFPIDPSTSSDGYIYFENVFKEYELKEQSDFDLNVLIRN